MIGARMRMSRLPTMGGVGAGWRRPLALLGILIALAWVLVAALAPWIAPADPIHQGFETLLPPSADHWMGTDAIGRDILSRVIWGARSSIVPGFLVVVIATTLGGLLGASAAYLGGLVDEAIMRFADLVFAFPTIVLAMAIVAILGPSTENAVVALGLSRWPAQARVVRSLVLALKFADYVNAARLLGASPLKVLRVEILPNVVGPVMVLAAIEVGEMILTLSALSFLGLGTPPPDPNWGAMVADGARVAQLWWIGAFPGLAIFTVVIGFNLFGDALRDALDPRLRRSLEVKAA
jgi:peptide/nickel transport system permease protein